MLPIIKATFLSLRDLYEKLLLVIVGENIVILLIFNLVLDEDKYTVFTSIGVNILQTFGNHVQFKILLVFKYNFKCLLK